MLESIILVMAMTTFLAAAFCNTLTRDRKIGFFPAFYSGKGTVEEQRLEILSYFGASGRFFLLALSLLAGVSLA